MGVKVVDITNEGAYSVLAQAGVLPSLAGGEGVRGRDLYNDGSWERQSVTSDPCSGRGLLRSELLAIPTAGN